MTTTDAEYGALVELLCARDIWPENLVDGSFPSYGRDPLCVKAASAIEALIRERDEAHETFSAYVETSQYAETVAFARATKAEARIAELEAGLRDATQTAIAIVKAQPFYPDTHTGMRQQWVKDQIVAKLRALLSTEASDDHQG